MILDILEEFGEKLNYTKLQKILFLITRKQEKKSFDFVPYKYGCFSFQANQDLFTLSKYNNVKSVVTQSSSNWVLVKSNINYYDQLRETDKYAIKTVKREINHFSQKDLIRYTYLNFPCYATKIQVAGDILTNDEMNYVSN